MTASAPATALPLLEQIAAEHPDYRDVTQLLERVRPAVAAGAVDPVEAVDAVEAGRSAGPAGPVGRVGPVGDTRPELPDEPVVTDERSSSEAPAPTRRPAPPRPPGGAKARKRLATWVRAGLLVAVLAGGWFAWRVLPSLLQKAGPLVAAACGTSATTPVATDVTIGCAPVAPTIDGSFDDWRSVPEHDADAAVFGAAERRPGLTATWQALWDTDALYLHAVVVDPVVTPTQGPAPQWWNGDAVSFEIGPDARTLARTAPLRQGQDFHVILAVRDDTDRRAAADVNTVGTSAQGRVVFATGSERPAISVVARSRDGGYELEARIPWSEVGRSVAPQRGDVLAMNVNLSDATGPGANWALRTMLSSNPQRSGANQNLPARWQSVALGDSG